MTPRAQSSAIGAILLTAVVVITVATAGVFVFGSIGDDDAVRVRRRRAGYSRSSTASGS